MERITRVRAGIITAIFCVILGFFAFKIYDLQIIDTDGNVDNTKTFTTWTVVKAARGEILDRNGNKLVSNRASYDLVFNHYVIISAEGTNDYLLSLVQLCRELEIPYNDHFPISAQTPFAYTLSEYNATWQGYFQSYLPEKGGLDSDISAPLLIKKLRQLYKIPETWSDQDARAVIGLRYELDLRQGITNLPNYVFIADADTESLSAILELNIPGLKTEASTVREYNTKYAAHILGYCSAMTQSQWDYYSTLTDSDGNSLYNKDAQVGQSGLELAFEEYLHGVDGIRVDRVTVDGTLVEQYYLKDENGVEQKPIAGKNVEITIDLNLQRTAEESMESLITSLRATAQEDKHVDGSDVEGGAVVVMDVKTGQILACASYPTYDLSTFREDWDELKDAEYAPLFNRALQATYPPGSTYKMSMVVAATQAEAIDRTTKIRDRGVFDKYAPFTASCLAWTNNHSSHGDITAVEALAVSCNYFFYEVGDKLNLSIIDSTAKSLGLGEPTGIELGEATGYRANAETKALFNKNDPDKQDWYRADQIMASIGQSLNQFSPIQLCSYTATLANRGVRYKATFLNRVVSPDYQHLELESVPTVLSTMTISDEAYYNYSEGMRAVVTSGTAYRIFGKYPIEVAAKTGTAQHSNSSNVSDHGAFVCYAPFQNPEIAIAVYGEKAGHGTTMGQIAKEILDTYFDNPEAGDVTTNENQIS